MKHFGNAMLETLNKVKKGF